MKLKNKLIPIGTILTAGATLAPVALTSCSSTMVNLINGYRPSIDKAVWEDYKADRNDMLTFYASAVNENPQIFAQDQYWSDATNSLYTADMAGKSYKITKLAAKASNIAVHKRNCKDFAEGTEETVVNYTIDFDYTFELSFDYIANGDESWAYFGSYNPGDVVTWDNSIKYTLKELPIVINRDDDFVSYGYYEAFEDGYLPTDWVLQANLYYDYDNDEMHHEAFTNLEKNGFNWSITYKYDISETITNQHTAEKETNFMEYNILFDKDELFDKLDNSMYYMAASYLIRWYTPSFYLSNIVDTNHQIWGE